MDLEASASAPRMLPPRPFRVRGVYLRARSGPRVAAVRQPPRSARRRLRLPGLQRRIGLRRLRRAGSRRAFGREGLAAAGGGSLVEGAESRLILPRRRSFRWSPLFWPRVCIRQTTVGTPFGDRKMTDLVEASRGLEDVVHLKTARRAFLHFGHGWFPGSLASAC